MREEFRKELEASGYIRFPLPLHRERALEREERKILETAVPFRPESASVTAPGRIRFEKADGDRTFLRLSGPTGRTFEPGKDYMESRRTSELSFAFEPADWRGYDRIAVRVKPECPGQHSVHFRLHLKNEGEKPVPDPYWREGACLCNLDNGVWNPVVWDFPMLPRDRVTAFTVTVDCDGRDLTDGPEYSFLFDAFELQKTAEPLNEYGWGCTPGRIACSMGGYQLSGRKTAVCGDGIECFSVEDEQGGIVFEGKAEKAEIAGFSLSLLDFTAIETPGFYRIRAGEAVSPLFEISEDALEESLWKLVNFIYCERCGFLVPGKHGRCHSDVHARHKGLILPFSGGWHDAGDMSQQTLQTGEVAEALLLAADACDDPVFSARLYEEGLWGLEYVLRSRFGDGFRASSVGLGAWSAGLIGDDDDVQVRVHCQAFQNFFLAGTEASAAYLLREREPMLSYRCLEAAKEDYRFAEERFREFGVEYPIMWEHTLGSSLSQYYAAAVRAAACICRMEKNPEFEREALKYAEKLLACQETGDAAPMKGFFRRSEDSPIIVHYTHQAREHCFPEAIESLLAAFPSHEKRPYWEEALRLYGTYLKSVFSYASPYGMIPAGLHHTVECEDRDTFPILHLQCDFDTEKPHYEAQLAAGEDLGNGYVLRQFPVWFSFRGNGAVMLSSARGASIAGRYFGDQELLDIARDQLYWMLGKNPFCQSLVYGLGERYASQDANFPGEMCGEIPVGVETLDDGDLPYWPGGNNCTYKEVWLTPAGRFLAVAADLAKAGRS